MNLLRKVAAVVGVILTVIGPRHLEHSNENDYYLFVLHIEQPSPIIRGGVRP